MFVITENIMKRPVFASRIIGTVLAVGLIVQVAARNLRLVQPIQTHWHNEPVKYIRRSHTFFLTDTLGHYISIYASFQQMYLRFGISN